MVMPRSLSSLRSHSPACRSHILRTVAVSPRALTTLAIGAGKVPKQTSGDRHSLVVGSFDQLGDENGLSGVQVLSLDDEQTLAIAEERPGLEHGDDLGHLHPGRPITFGGGGLGGNVDSHHRRGIDSGDGEELVASLQHLLPFTRATIRLADNRQQRGHGILPK